MCLGFSPQGWRRSRGRIEGVTHETVGGGAGYQGELIVASLPSTPGNAGAPILDGSGAVIGILYGGLGTEAAETYLLPVDSLRAALSEVGLAVG